MRTRTGAMVLLCCAAVAACTAAPKQGPDVTVTPPDVGKPAPPGSVQAAISRMAFTPYAALGQSTNDGLAPDESADTLGQACLSTAGYPDLSGALPVGFRIAGGLAFSFPWGPWGYLGTADAQEYGFAVPAGSALSELGLAGPGAAAPASQGTLSKAEQTALGKCAAIVQDFDQETASGPLAGIASIGAGISTDLARNPAVRSATGAWRACMARNGFTVADPASAAGREAISIRSSPTGGTQITIGQQAGGAQNEAQIAMAVTDANCTAATDLAGIYFAVQASYEQQIVDANQQALTAAVRQYRADYATDIAGLPKLLATTKAQPFTGKAVQVAGGKQVAG